MDGKKGGEKIKHSSIVTVEKMALNVKNWMELR